MLDWMRHSHSPAVNLLHKSSPSLSFSLSFLPSLSRILDVPVVYQTTTSAGCQSVLITGVSVKVGRWKEREGRVIINTAALFSVYPFIIYLVSRRRANLTNWSVAASCQKLSCFCFGESCYFISLPLLDLFDELSAIVFQVNTFGLMATLPHNFATLLLPSFPCLSPYPLSGLPHPPPSPLRVPFHLMMTI